MQLYFDLEKGLYDQARKKVATQRAIKQTEEAISSASPEEKKPRFTMQHLAAAKEKFKQTHGVAADTTRKSFLDLVKGDAPLPKKVKKPRATDGGELTPKERASVKRPGVVGAVAGALLRSDVPEWFQKAGAVGDAQAASKAAHSASAAAHAGQGGHDVAAKAHRDAANKHWRVMNRVNSDTPKHEKHRQLMKQHYSIAESHDKLTVGKSLPVPDWFYKAQL